MPRHGMAQRKYGGRSHPSASLRVLALGSLGASLAVTIPAAAQTDYYNTDRNRPVRIEDAHPTELYAFELKIAPLRLEREQGGGVYRWSLNSEVAYGILPRTAVEVGIPVGAVQDGPTGLAGIELSTLYNLNVETRTLPALGLRGDVDLPIGPLGPDRVHASLTGLATRTWPIARFHVNARYTFGRGDDEDQEVVAELNDDGRWLAGVAVDRVFPLRAALLIADLFVVRPFDSASDLQWNAGAGLRYQVNPYLALDAGLGRTFTGDPRWYLTFGSALHLGIRSLIPQPR